jgi:alpha-1,3-rhamnosyltransferase
MNYQDKVSVIIPSFNHARFVRQSVYSALFQNFNGLIEVVVVDDSSTDETKLLLKDIGMESLPAGRELKIFYKQENKGINHSIEFGLANSTGQYIQILASDDYISPEKLRLQFNYIKKNRLDGVYSTVFQVMSCGAINRVFLKAFKASVEGKTAYDYVCKRDFDAPLLQSGLFSREVMESASQVRREFKSDDWAFLLHAFKNFNVGFFDEPLTFYRIHESNTHSNYWRTLPMRLDVAARLVPLDARSECIGNILTSHGAYLFGDRLFFAGVRFMLAGLVFSPKTISLSLKVVMSAVVRCFR